jgi:hypothetical protein
MKSGPSPCDCNAGSHAIVMSWTYVRFPPITDIGGVSAFDAKRTLGSRFDGVLNAEITLALATSSR